MFKHFKIWRICKLEYNNGYRKVFEIYKKDPDLFRMNTSYTTLSKQIDSESSHEYYKYGVKKALKDLGISTPSHFTSF